jgi:hypothetical protein
MTTSILVVRSAMRFLMLAQLVLGILFWTGHAMGLVQLHMAVGGLFVVGLWLLAFLTGIAGAPRLQVLLVVVLGALIALVGYTQVQLLPGAYHWVVRVVHLLLGLLAIPLAGRLSMAVRRPDTLPPHGLVA